MDDEIVEEEIVEEEPTITIDAKRYKTENGSWGSWQSASGWSDDVSSYVGRVEYRFIVSYENATDLKSVTYNLLMKGSSARTYNVRAYTATTAGAYPNSSTTLKYTAEDKTLSTSGTSVTISHTGFSTTSQYIYLTVYANPYDSAYHVYAAGPGGGSPSASGTFTIPATLSLSVSVTDLGVATLSATSNVSCGSWAYQVDSGDWNYASGTGTSKTFTVNGMTGTHTYRVKATDSATSTVVYSNTVTKSTDTSAPTISLSVSVTDLGVATLTATSNVSCDSWAYQTDSGNWGAISGTGTSVTKTLNGMTGTHTYRVKATKTSNNVTGYSSTVTKSTDTDAPVITLTATVDGLGNATLSATADASCGSWQYQVDGAGSWNTISGTGTSKSVTVPGMTGTHSFQVRATKTSNNVTGYSQVKSTTSDQSAPTITASASVNSSGTVTLSATASDSCSGWAYKVDNGEWNGVTGTASSKTFTISGMTGSHTFQVKATKVSNNAVGYSSAVTTTTPTLALSSTAVNTSGSLTITVRYLPANTKVLLKYGSSQLDYYQYSSYQDSKTITLSSSDLTSLFSDSGVTTQQSISITVSVNGYSYTATSFTLSTGSNMSPTVGTPTATIVQGSTVDSSLSSVYIAGFSKVKIAATVTAGSGSSISTVKLSYGTSNINMSYNSSTGKYEATTSAPITGNTTFTVTATDARGLTGTATYSLTGVKSWTEPVITFDTNYTYRCNSSGTKQEGGPYVRVKVTATYNTGISGNGIRGLDFYIKEDGTSTKHNLTSGTQSSAYALGSPRPDTAITVVVECRDKVGGWVTRELQLQGGHRDFALANYNSSTAGGHVTALGIGMAPDTSIAPAQAGDTVQLPARGRFTIGGMEAQNFIGAHLSTEINGSTRWNKNLLTYDSSNPFSEDNETAEFYITSSDLANWTNIPSAVTGTFEGTRFVVVGYDNAYIIILEYTPVAGRIWVNAGRKGSSNTTWSGWKGHTPDIT